MKEWVEVQEFNVIKIWRLNANNYGKRQWIQALEHYDQVTVDSLAEADRFFSMLMGDEVPQEEIYREKCSIYKY
jgi:hypothetical protein